MDLAAASYARAFAHTVPEEEMPALRRALGEILAEVSGEPAALWHAYRLLAGSAEAVPPILDLARDQPAAVPPKRLFQLVRRRYPPAAAHFAAALDLHRRHGDTAAALLDRGWQLELALAQEDSREVRRLTRELTGKVEEVPVGSRAAFAFRLSRGLDWLHERGQKSQDSVPLLESAYRQVLGTAGTLAPELRHRYLFEIADHAAILAAASARHLVA